MGEKSVNRKRTHGKPRRFEPDEDCGYRRRSGRCFRYFLQKVQFETQFLRKKAVFTNSFFLCLLQKIVPFVSK